MTTQSVTPRKVKCPVCGAKPGEPCNTRPVAGENVLRESPGRSHPERFALARQATGYKLADAKALAEERARW
jgi:hypothetical protein